MQTQEFVSQEEAVVAHLFWAMIAVERMTVQVAGKAAQALEEDPDAGLALEALPELIDQLEGKMKEAAKKLDFEDAANLRDRIKQLRKKMAG